MVSGSLNHVRSRKNFSSLPNPSVGDNYLVSEPAQGTALPATLQSEDLQSRWDHHLLLLVVRRRNSLECLQTLQSLLAPLCLVRSHPSDSPPEDLGGSPEVEGTTAGLHVATLLQEVKILQLVAVEVSCDDKS